MSTPITDETIDLASETLSGDIRDFLLDRIKTFGKPWVAMTEDEQREQIISAKEAANHLVREAVKIIASEGRKVIAATLDKVTVKDGIKAEISLAKTDELRHELIDSQGQAVLVVVAGVEEFQGERAPADPMPNQVDMLANAESLKNSNVKKLK